MKFKDRKTEFPNRRKLNILQSQKNGSGEIAEMIVTVERVEGEITEYGTPLNAENLNKITEELSADINSKYDEINGKINTLEPAIEKNTAFNKDFETSSANIKMDGTASTGTSVNVARADHVHPTDTSRAAASHIHTPAEIGAATASHTHTPADIGAAAALHTHTPTETGAAPVSHIHGNNDLTGIADWAKATNKPLYSASEIGLGNVTNESKATMFASPIFSGVPIAPSAATTIETEQIATTRFVHNAIENKRPYATENPKADGMAAIGSSNKVARADHTHPSIATAITINGELQNMIDLNARLRELVYPVGSIYMSVNAVNPGSFFGGTWIAWGAGRVPVGINSNDSDFSTSEKLGGWKGLAQHNHSAIFTGSSVTSDSTTATNQSTTATNQSTTATNQSTTATNQSTTATNQNVDSHAHTQQWRFRAKTGKTTVGNDYGMDSAAEQVVTNYHANGVTVSTMFGNDSTRTVNTLSAGGHTHIQDAHNHTQNDHTHTQNAHSHNQNSHSHNQYAHAHTLTASGSVLVANSGANENTGGAINGNLQPYITCYMWKRTA